MYIKTLETNIKLKQQKKNLNGISDHTKSTDLIIDIIKRIKISGETVPLTRASIFLYVNIASSDVVN